VSETRANAIPEDADPDILFFLNAWKSARHGAIMPRKSDWNPMSVPRLLADIFLYQLDQERGDFRCLLAGETINDAWGGSVKGKMLREVVGPVDHPTVLGRWFQILRTPLLHYGKASERLTELRTRSAERLLTPLSNDDGEPEFVLGLALYRFSMSDLSQQSLFPEDIIQIPCDSL